MNILFITADQWRGECLSLLNNPHVKTPNLDALASDGVAFKNHYGQATPCGPSRTSLYTGMYMHNHRSLLNGTPLDARHTNVALEARKAGYQPALFGYTDISLDPRSQEIFDGYQGVLPGMDPECVLNGGIYEPWLDYLREKGYNVPQNPREIFTPQKLDLDAETKGKTFAPALYNAEDSNAAFLTNKAIKYLKGCNDSPWFAHLSFLSPHPPFITPEPYNSMFDERDMPLPIRCATWQEEIEQHPWLAHYLAHPAESPYTIGASSADNLTLPDLELRQLKATYYGMIAEVDAQMGRLISYLKEAGAYDNTLIVFTSDHGENLGDHWAHSKCTYFDTTFHIPLIVRDPSAEADSTRGHIINDFTESVDVMPTILEAIGVDIPMQCDGHSILPFCHGEKPLGWREEYHAEFDMRAPYSGEGAPPLGLKTKHCMVNIICGKRYKYVHFVTLPPLLFDLENDPDEFLNLASDPTYKEVMSDYAQKLLSWRMEHDEPALTDLHLTNEGSVINGMRTKLG